MDVRASGVSPPINNGGGGDGGRERGASEKGCAAGEDGRARETEWKSTMSGRRAAPPSRIAGGHGRRRRRWRVGVWGGNYNAEEVIGEEGCQRGGGASLLRVYVQRRRVAT